MQGNRGRSTLGWQGQEGRQLAHLAGDHTELLPPFPASPRECLPLNAAYCRLWWDGGVPGPLSGSSPRTGVFRDGPVPLCAQGASVTDSGKHSARQATASWVPVTIPRPQQVKHQETDQFPPSRNHVSGPRMEPAFSL